MERRTLRSQGSVDVPEFGVPDPPVVRRDRGVALQPYQAGTTPQSTPPPAYSVGTASTSSSSYLLTSAEIAAFNEMFSPQAVRTVTTATDAPGIQGTPSLEARPAYRPPSVAATEYRSVGSNLSGFSSLSSSPANPTDLGSLRLSDTPAPYSRPPSRVTQPGSATASPLYLPDLRNTDARTLTARLFPTLTPNGNQGSLFEIVHLRAYYGTPLFVVDIVTNDFYAVVRGVLQTTPFRAQQEPFDNDELRGIMDARLAETVARAQTPTPLRTPTPVRPDSVPRPGSAFRTVGQIATVTTVQASSAEAAVIPTTAITQFTGSLRTPTSSSVPNGSPLVANWGGYGQTAEMQIQRIRERPNSQLRQAEQGSYIQDTSSAQSGVEPTRAPTPLIPQLQSSGITSGSTSSNQPSLDQLLDIPATYRNSLVAPLIPSGLDSTSYTNPPAVLAPVPALSLIHI